MHLDGSDARTRRRLTPIVLAIAALTAAIAWWIVPVDRLPQSVVGLRPTHVRIVWSEAPATSATILWTTAEPGRDHAVWIGRGPDVARRGDRATGVDDVRTSRFPNPEGSDLVAHLHCARIADLTPDTRYWFVVSNEREVSEEFWFRTAPTGDRPFALLAGGDCLDRRGPRQVMNRRIASLVEDDPSILALAHGGDFVRHGERLVQWLEWLEDHQLTTTDDNRVLPIIPARGNHEATGPLFDAVFDSPGQPDRNWYVTELSAAVVLVTLCTERPHFGDQLEFLRTALADRSRTRFKLAQYHRELWPAVKRSTNRTPEWVDAFETHDLDLAIECNGHCIKRTVPIRDGAIADDGVTYIGDGGLGAKQRTPDPDRWWLRPPGFTANGDHVWKLAFDADHLVVKAILADGTTLDTHTIAARER